MSNKFDLHESRLGTTNEDGSRHFLFPEEVKGKWKNRRTYFYWFLIFIYLVLPWIKVGGKQTILLDISKREFTFFTHTFYAHNAPMILFFLLGFVFTIGFITSIWGRVWCGWACPQTVFIETIFRKVEEFVEGNARKRQKLDQAPWDSKKIFKRVTKWSLFMIISLHIAHTFLGYFVGTHFLLGVSMQSPFEHLGLFIAMLVITGIIFLDFGWFREQFCLIACPYGRFQSVMMDKHSLAVLYDEKRGEPRRQKGQAKGEHGDCIDCHACVRVCPTGIDIRRGVQLECIACTNCIDACDDIMTRTGREPGLIRYDTEANMEGEETKVFKPRNIVYLIAIIGLFSGFLYSLSISTDLMATVLRGPGSPFRVLKSEDKVLNHFQITLDQSGTIEQKEVLFEIMPKELSEKIEIKMQKNPYPLKKNHERVNVFLKFNKDILKNGSRGIIFKLTDKSVNKVLNKEVKIVGPIK